MKNLLFKSTATAILLVVISACGGGGGGDSAVILTNSDSTTESNTQSVSASSLFAEDATLPDTYVLPEVKILPAGEKRTMEANIGVPDTTYSLRGNPSWITVDEISGLLTFDNKDPGSTESYSFTVIATSADGIRISNTISGHVKLINETLINDLENPAIFQIEAVGSALTSVTAGANYLVPRNMNPATEAENVWDVVQPYYKDYGRNNEVVIINGQTNVVSKFYPEENNRYNIANKCISQEGNLYLFTRDGGTLHTRVAMYNPSTGVFTEDILTLPADFAGTEVVHGRIGPDGKMYLTGQISGDTSDPYYHNLQFAIIDTSNNTYTIRKFTSGAGAVSSLPWNIAIDTEYVYILAGKVPWRVVQYKLSDGTTKILAEAESGVNILHTEYGALLNTGGSSGQYFFLYHDTVTEAIHSSGWKWAMAPWDTNYPDSFTDSDKFSTLNTPQDIVEAHLPPRPETELASISPTNGFSDMWIKQPAVNAQWTKTHYSVLTYSKILRRVLPLSNGKILAGVEGFGMYMTYDPMSNTTINSSGRLGLSLYTMLEYNNKVYMSGYPSGQLYEYDYTKPWTNGNPLTDPNSPPPSYLNQSLNPRYVGPLSESGSGAHKMYGSAVGADGYLYFGGIWMRDGNGGGLSWYNPQTDVHTGIWEEFSGAAISHLSTVMDGNYILISTTPVTDVQLSKPKAESGRIYVFNTQAKKVEPELYCDPMAGLSHTSGSGQILGVDGSYVVGLSYNPNPNDEAERKSTYIYRCNLRTHKLDYRLRIERNGFYGGSTIGTTIKKSLNGKIITLLGGKMVELDPISGDIRVIAKYDDPNSIYNVSGGLSFGDGEAYMSGYDKIIKLPNLLY